MTAAKRFALVLVVIALGVPVALAQQPFVDVTEQVGLNLRGSAAAWGDFDDDGWVDLYSGGTLWRNEAGKRFTRVTDTSLAGEGGLWGDFDNDGYLDLYCWGNGKLFRNLEGKGFADVTELLPRRPMKVCRGAAWGDFNGDGYLDLYVGGYEIWKTQEEYPDVILINRKGEVFDEIWRTRGKILRARGITTADFDEDGRLDVYVSNYRLQPNILWRGDGKGAFVDVAAASGTAGDGGLGAWGHTIGSAFADLDNDGRLDLFVGNFSHPPAYQDRPKFLRNLGPKGGYRFEDKTGGAGLAWQESFASPALGDFDNDGWVDLFFTTVYPGDKSVLYRNNGDWTFTNVTDQAGLATERTYQAAWADFDNDGDLDLVSGGRLFANPATGNHWLKVCLACKGTPVGAQVRVLLKDATLTRQVESATGEGNQNDLTLHFGLGSHAEAVDLEIHWPDGATQKMTTPIDQCVTVTR